MSDLLDDLRTETAARLAAAMPSSAHDVRMAGEAPGRFFATKTKGTTGA